MTTRKLLQPGFFVEHDTQQCVAAFRAGKTRDFEHQRLVLLGAGEGQLRGLQQSSGKGVAVPSYQPVTQLEKPRGGMTCLERTFVVELHGPEETTEVCKEPVVRANVHDHKLTIM